MLKISDHSPSHAPTGCGLTIVEAHGPVLAKRWHADGTATPYGNARTVSLHTRPVADLADLARMLRRLLTVPYACVVRGEPIDPERTERVRRLLRPDDETGDLPTLRDVPRRWVAVDLDSVPLPSGVAPSDLVACARAVRRVLPHAFRDCAAIVCATASHAIKPGARLRLWFWLSRPTCGTELRNWFRDTPADRTVFRAVQPIYTAAPLFDAGLVDPLADRLASLPGARELVEVPAPLLLGTVRRASVPPPCNPQRGGADRFAALTRTVRSAAEGSRHPTLYWAACRAGEMVAAGEIEADRAVSELVRAAMDAGGASEVIAKATARDGIARGKGGAA